MNLDEIIDKLAADIKRASANLKTPRAFKQIKQEAKQGIEAYISKHYVKKADVLEELNQIRSLVPIQINATGFNEDMLKGWNAASLELIKYANKRIEKLTKGE